ncbi:patatin-like phospholipase family protein [Caloramator sp. mosi_1]|uniref:patatin-like phospholipase family protein n=1 Tax=Caloramator sp. mosi_1 TaxID=3023090 RepID=UPI00236202AC|nr:patatin-like phospholipase family protein [Caloramator sp. mosi_1]WDC84571.1 patatin-like phospholipase family protein [Caloramator sp. mosi_1]
MRYGLCLTGGGAKGAYEAGILKYFKEKGFNFSVVTGTSIGAVNGYFMLKNAYEEMYSFWLSMCMNKYFDSLNMVVENRRVIQELEKLEGYDNSIDSFYVNYVEVKGCSISEVVVDIKNFDKEKALEAVKASSLLPYNYDGEPDKVSAKILFEQFKIDLQEGKYDGYKLDGGILNNCLLKPFINDRVDKIFIIALSNDFQVPEYIYQFYKKKTLLFYYLILK